MNQLAVASLVAFGSMVVLNTSLGQGLPGLGFCPSTGTVDMCGNTTGLTNLCVGQCEICNVGKSMTGCIAANSTTTCICYPNTTQNQNIPSSKIALTTSKIPLTSITITTNEEDTTESVTMEDVTTQQSTTEVTTEEPTTEEDIGVTDHTATLQEFSGHHMHHNISFMYKSGGTKYQYIVQLNDRK